MEKEKLVEILDSIPDKHKRTEVYDYIIELVSKCNDYKNQALMLKHNQKYHVYSESFTPVNVDEEYVVEEFKKELDRCQKGMANIKKLKIVYED